MNESQSNISQIIAFQIPDVACYMVLHYIAFRCPLDQERNSRSKPWRWSKTVADWEQQETTKA